MRLTKEKLMQIIKEELDAVMESESDKILRRMRSQDLSDEERRALKKTNSDSSAGDSVYLTGGEPNVYGKEILGLAETASDFDDFLKDAKMIGTEFEGLTPKAAYEWALNHLEKKEDEDNKKTS